MEMRSLYKRMATFVQFHDKLHTAKLNISKAQTKQNRQYDRKHEIPLYSFDDPVLYRKTVEVKLATTGSWRCVGRTLGLSRILEKRGTATKWCEAQGKHQSN